MKQAEWEDMAHKLKQIRPKSHTRTLLERQEAEKNKNIIRRDQQVERMKFLARRLSNKKDKNLQQNPNQREDLQEQLNFFY